LKSFESSALHIVVRDNTFSNWIRQRKDKIIAKGKGELVTFWLEMKSNNSGCQSSRSSESGTGSSHRSEEEDQRDTEDNTVIPGKALQLFSEKTERLIDWNSDVLCRLLRQILCSREGTTTLSMTKVAEEHDSDIAHTLETGTLPFDEVQEIIALPPLKLFNKNQPEALEVHVPQHVAVQLRDYVAHIAAMYKENKFHNFEHVSTSIVFVCKIHFFIWLTLKTFVRAYDFFSWDFVSVLTTILASHLLTAGISRHYECHQVVVSYCSTI
jgi:hypothetical protein